MQGNAAARNNLGFCYHDGRGVPEDYSQEVYRYRLSAQQGRALGQSNYGTCPEFGRGVRKDLNVAIEMYRRSARTGFSEKASQASRYCTVTQTAEALVLQFLLSAAESSLPPVFFSPERELTFRAQYVILCRITFSPYE